MSKVIFILILSVVSASVNAANWKEEKSKDEMTGKVIKFSTTESINTVSFDFPYKGKQHGILHVSEGGTALFYVEKGQITCHSKCYLRVKFDDKEADLLSATKVGDDSTTIKFTEKSFFTKLKAAKKVFIEATIFRNGLHIFKFNVDGLKTEEAPRKKDEKLATIGANAAAAEDVGAVVPEVKRKVYLGVHTADTQPQMFVGTGHEFVEGLVITYVVAGSTAEKYGLKVNDIIYMFDGKPIKKIVDLQKYVSESSSGQSVVIKFLRAGKESGVTLIFDSTPRVIENPIKEYELIIEAGKLNKTMPRMIDKETRLDKVVGKNSRLIYNHTLINTASASVTQQRLSEALEAVLERQVCTTKAIVDGFIKRGVTLEYTYFGNDGGLIGNVTITPEQCFGKY
jgi:hypothetical protein